MSHGYQLAVSSKLKVKYPPKYYLQFEGVEGVYPGRNAFTIVKNM